MQLWIKEICRQVSKIPIRWRLISRSQVSISGNIDLKKSLSTLSNVRELVSPERAAIVNIFFCSKAKSCLK